MGIIGGLRIVSSSAAKSHQNDTDARSQEVNPEVGSAQHFAPEHRHSTTAFSPLEDSGERIVVMKYTQAQECWSVYSAP